VGRESGDTWRAPRCGAARVQSFEAELRRRRGIYTGLEARSPAFVKAGESATCIDMDIAINRVVPPRAEPAEPAEPAETR
jgi:hypothetical protein